MKKIFAAVAAPPLQARGYPMRAIAMIVPQAAAKARKDGDTLLMTIRSPQAINPARCKVPGFDPVKASGATVN